MTRPASASVVAAVARSFDGAELHLAECDDASVAVATLLPIAGVTAVAPVEILAFGVYRADPAWEHERSAYRERTGRAEPPLYRVRVVVEATELSPAETEAHWQWIAASVVDDG